MRRLDLPHLAGGPTMAEPTITILIPNSEFHTFETSVWFAAGTVNMKTVPPDNYPLTVRGSVVRVTAPQTEVLAGTTIRNDVTRGPDGTYLYRWLIQFVNEAGLLGDYLLRVAWTHDPTV